MKKTFALFSVMLMLAAAALACQGGPLGNIFATVTPTPTDTPTITPSPTITPTLTPTVTPLPTTTPTPKPEGVVSESAEGDATVLTDHDNGYRLTLSTSWTVIPIGAEDMSRLLDKYVEQNPSMKNAAEAFRKLDPKLIRVVALNGQKEYISANFATNLTIVALEDQMMSAMPIAFITGALESNMERGGAKVISRDVNIVESDSGVEVGFLEVERTLPGATGKDVTVRMRLLVFQANGRLVMVTLSCVKDFIEPLSKDLEEIAQSVEVFKP